MDAVWRMDELEFEHIAVENQRGYWVRAAATEFGESAARGRSYANSSTTGVRKLVVTHSNNNNSNKHAHAGPSDCITHIRALLVLQTPRHFGPRN